MMAKDRPLRLALAQINTTVGDLDGNASKIIEYINRGREADADIIVFPELAITGYPPEDLLLKPAFIERNLDAIEQVVTKSSGIVVICGFVEREKDGSLYNSAAVINNGKIAGTHRKVFLPNYGVFDECRYFTRGTESIVFKLDNVIFGVNVCEDIWYPNGPHNAQAKAGADIIININASPFHSEKWKEREHMLAERAQNDNIYCVYLNAVGGQDELVFDGHSMVLNPKGKIISRGHSFQEELLLLDIATEEHRDKKSGTKITDYPISLVDLGEPKITDRKPIVPAIATPPPRVEEVYQALVLGTKDYVRKNGFKHVGIGISGGIDSALTAAVAVDALGKESVTGVMMPSRFTSDLSIRESIRLGECLGIDMITIPIDAVFEEYKNALRDVFAGTKEDVTEENIQARIRGNYLMALSNKFGWLILTTGNKSEMATGYATLYGDMAGGFAVLKDVPKTLVYELAHYRNSISPVIPEAIITRPPSAELRANQLDQDSLPPYDVLDPILHHYIVEDASVAEIIAKGFPEDVVRRVVSMVDKNEYKRRQAPPGIKITPKAFGRDRRLPITNAFKE